MALKTIWYINANNGDGSSRTEFYDSYEAIEYLTDDDLCLEDYQDGDGGSYGSFSVPEGTEITGIDIETLEDAKAAHGSEEAEE